MIDAIVEADQDLVLNWLAPEGPASIARLIAEHDPAVPFEPNSLGICHLRNDIFTRPDTREVLHVNASKAHDRIARHRAFLEAARGDKELAGLYVKS